MNHVYQLVWSHVRNGWVAVAETARRRHKGSGRTLLTTTLSLAAVLAHAGQPGLLGGHIVSGSGAISTAGNTTTITQSSPTLSLTWLNFDIAPQQTVDFVQPSASAIAVNHILSTSGTEILGRLDANGRIYLINPNGILFGKGAQVNVGGLVASTLALDEGSLSGSARSFSGTGTGGVINRGSITAASGGFVALIGRTVVNQGSIVARLGNVALGAGSSVTLTFAGDALIGMQVDRSALQSVAANGGLIQADGGRVTMTAGAKNALLASVVNNTGVIEARTVEDHGGTITLLGGMTAGTVNVGGTLDASAPNDGSGGSIETSAAHVEVTGGAKVTTAAAHGLVGTWVIDPQDFTVASSGGDETGVQLGTALDSTNVQLESGGGANSGSGNVSIDDPVTWSANTTLTLTASNDVIVNASLTAAGAGAGLVIDPNTANGVETASGTGTLNLAAGASINLPNVAASSTNALVIAGQAYTVVNSLGAAGSTTGADLQGINGNASGHYALGSDIDASATASWNGGAGFTPIGSASTPFTGTLDGLGHTIAGLTIQLPGSDDVGLFGFSSGAIQNVGLTGAAVTGGAYSVGGLAGLNRGAMSNSYVTGTVMASLNSTGGLAGRNYGTISGSHMDGTVNAVDNVGGLAGLNGGTIIDSYATGRVTGAYDVGGLVGDSSGGTIDDSYATSTAQGVNNIGGLVGFNNQTIENSYSTGSATASGSNVGGLLGANYGTVSNSFWNETTSGRTSSAGGTGLTTTQMQTASSFSGFNFTATAGATGNAWVMVDTDGSLNNAGGAAGATYPMLASEYSTSIGTAHQLQLVAMATGASYTLSGDLDAAGTSGGDVWNSSAGFVPIGSSSAPFTGTLDGLGHTISNLTIDLPSQGRTGLFGQVGSSGVVENLGLVNANVTGSSQVGALAGLSAGTLSNVYATGTVNGSSYTGGLLGVNNGTVEGSHALVAVTAANYGVGGLVGYNSSYGTVSNTYATGTVIDNGSFGRRAGGLVGTNSGMISESHATGPVSGNHAIGGFVGASWGTIADSYATGAAYASDGQGGGLVGVNLGPVSDSYATGTVTGSGSQFGGLAGGNGGAISSSYATGAVDAPTSYVGGLIGGNYGTVTDSYSTGSVTGSSYVGGLVGGNQYGSGSTTVSFWDETTSGQTASAGGTGLTTLQMQQQGSFSGWDFTSTWTIYPDNTDPLLQAFMTPLTVTAGNATMTYSGAQYSGANGVTYSATPNGNLLGTLTYGGSAGGAIDAGSYTITPRGLYSDQQDYLITFVSGTLTVDPATLTYVASPTSLTAGQSPSGLTGQASGFVGKDTLASATSGTLVWSTPATASSAAGSYAVDGSGLTAANYVFIQASANATALTLTLPAGNSGGSPTAGGSSGGTGDSSTGTGDSSAGAGSSSSSSPGNSPPVPSATPPQPARNAVAGFDADVLPLLASGAAQPSAAAVTNGVGSSPEAAPPADAAFAGSTLELGGRGRLRVLDHGVRLPSLPPLSQP